MDTSKTYVRMCECAEEIQEQMPSHIGDDGRFRLTRFGDNVYMRIGGTQNDEGFCDGYKLVWLPRWDQLLEILIERVGDGIHDDTCWFKYSDRTMALKSLYEFALKEDCRFDSHEQLLLAFVMREKHGKVWSGEDWEKK